MVPTWHPATRARLPPALAAPGAVSALTPPTTPAWLARFFGTQDPLGVDSDVGVALGMHAAQKAQVPVALLAPIQRPWRLAGGQQRLVAVLHDESHLLQERRCPGRHINGASLPDHALDDVSVLVRRCLALSRADGCCRCATSVRGIIFAGRSR